MAVKSDHAVSSCWVAAQGLIGLQNQAKGLAQALGFPYDLKEIRKPWGWGILSPEKYGLTPPWPDVLITCGCQSAAVSVAVRRASRNKTFTVHIQDPLMNPKHFDVVIVPEHDKLRGKNVFVTQGSVHHVTTEKLEDASRHFKPLLGSLPRPLISVLVGGKNKHQELSAPLVRDFAQKLVMAAKLSGGGLAVTPSRRTGAANEAMLRRELAEVPSYIWDGQGENPYFGLLGLGDVIVVTSDSISMISESCSTAKPVYIYELPNAGKRHKLFVENFIQKGFVRPFWGSVEPFKAAALNETQKAADFVRERLTERLKK
ncbi:MAG: mitochondrial fission ELM1 family protein [Candidatus Omnitrophica bacterium]|nr:mitochondrial fission ELM1 family protein [Candidatus Omnitrophota bacterium]MDE2214728.1 mitochondrial fission ELM1 family protein [Candidatus Omnitrophota bacterium]MDE2231789.1 mitochondrial fission ELM1 family protein [Candidatus Omnitrophota bacterium]